MAENQPGLFDDDLLNCQETAELLRLALSTLERMRLAGTGPTFIKLGQGKRSRVVYRRGDIETWLKSQTFQSTSQYGRKS